MISYYDYATRYPNAKQDLLRLVRDTASSGEFILKSAVERFENQLSAKLRARHAIAVSSGTSAMILALKAAGIKPGDEVITPAYSYVASASAICAAGALPVFADVTNDSFTLCPKATAAALSNKTRAVIAAHLFSGLADMEGLRRVLPPNVMLLEDAATAYGAIAGNTPAGSLGDVGIISFFPGKPLGGLGDGGAVITNNEELAQTVRMLRNHGQDGKNRFLHHLLGYNSRMDDLNARHLLERLPLESVESARRRKIFKKYDFAMADVPEVSPQSRRAYHFAPHAYGLRCLDRDGLVAHLQRRGIESKVHFPLTLPQQPAFAEYAHHSYSVAETLATSVLALPSSAALSDAEIDYITAAVREYYK